MKEKNYVMDINFFVDFFFHKVILIRKIGVMGVLIVFKTNQHNCIQIDETNLFFVKIKLEGGEL